MASAGRGTNYNCLFLFPVYFLFLPSLMGLEMSLSLIFPLPFCFSFLGLDYLSFSIFVQFLGWLKCCEFLKTDSFFGSYSFRYLQATPNITRAAIISTLFSTDYFIGHTFILTLSIVVLPSRCAVLYYKLGVQLFLRPHFVPRSKLSLSEM